MYKSVVVLYCFILSTMSLIGMLAPNSELSILMDTGRVAALFHLSLAFALATYTLVADLRLKGFRVGLGLLGIALIGTGLVSMINPNWLFLQPLDLFFIVEGGILSLIAVLDFARPLPAKRPVFSRRLIVDHFQKPRLPVYDTGKAAANQQTIPS